MEKLLKVLNTKLKEEKAYFGYSKAYKEGRVDMLEDLILDIRYSIDSKNYKFEDDNTNKEYSKLSFHHWDGGSGLNDKTEFVGYVDDTPLEVLMHMKNKYPIMYYKGQYRPIDASYPNNVYGYCIESVSAKELPFGLNGSICELELKFIGEQKPRVDNDIIKYIEKAYENEIANEILDMIRKKSDSITKKENL